MDSIQEHLRKHPPVPGEQIAVATVICAGTEDFMPATLTKMINEMGGIVAKCDCCECGIIYQSDMVPRTIREYHKLFADHRVVVTRMCMDCAQKTAKYMAERGLPQHAVVGNTKGGPQFRQFEKAMAGMMGVDYIDPVQNN